MDTRGALYQRLPDELRSTVSPDNFHDFVRRLVQVGEADDAGFDEARRRPSGPPCVVARHRQMAAWSRERLGT